MRGLAAAVTRPARPLLRPPPPYPCATGVSSRSPTTGGGLVAKVKVEGGKATWTIPADRKAGVVFVRDSASMTDVAVEIEAKQ